MNYAEALAYIQSFSDIERSTELPVAPPRFNLERVHRLLDLAGRPQDRFKSIHIAGTKGKGSTAAIVDAVLRASGRRTGLYTSPHLHSFCERIAVDGDSISQSSLAAHTAELAPLIELVHERYPELGRLTTFEVTTAVAMAYFAKSAVDYALLEVGMGGRLDATNVVRPEVGVITSISVDHTRYLGQSLLEIAGEKAGIIKPGMTIVIAPQRPEVMQMVKMTCQDRGARSIELGRDIQWTTQTGSAGPTVSVRGRLGSYPDLGLPLLGAHQADNTAAAVAAIEVLMEQGALITAEHIRRGVESVWWPGRLETVASRPRIVVDGAHNVDSMRKLRVALRQCFSYRRLLVIMGCSVGHDAAAMVQEMAPAASVFITVRSSHPRSVDAGLLADAALRHCQTERCQTVWEAPEVVTALRIAQELASEDDLICVTGSLFVVADAREALGLRSTKDRFVPKGELVV